MREVDLYRCDLDASDLDRLRGYLSSDESDRAGRFHFDRDRNRFIARRGRLRQILSGYLGLPAEGIRFFHNPYGRPEIDGIYFNVSHSAGRAVYAVSRTRRVGVDIERIQPGVIQERIPEHFFSPTEAAALRALPPEIQPEAFFECWTRKEAYVKALGGGLSIALDSFDVTFGPDRKPMILRGEGNWDLENLETEEGFKAALVAERGGFEPPVQV